MPTLIHETGGDGKLRPRQVLPPRMSAFGGKADIADAPLTASHGLWFGHKMAAWMALKNDARPISKHSVKQRSYS